MMKKKKKPTQIPSKLMIYRSPRHFKIRPYNLKYGLYPHELDVKWVESLSKSLKRFLSSSMKKFIDRALHCVIALYKPLAAIYLRSITQIRTIKVLDLQVGLTFSLDPHQQRKIRLYQFKLVKRICMACSKVEKLQLTSVPFLSDATMLPLKHATLLRSLQHFHYSPMNSLSENIQSLSNYLVHNLRQTTDSFSISIAKNRDLVHFKDEIQKLVSVSPNSKITLTLLDCPDTKLKYLTPFAPILQNLPNLKDLIFTSPLNKAFLHLLKMMQDNQYLQSLTLTLTPSDKTSDVLALFPKIITSLKSLNQLQVYFEDFQRTRTLNSSIFDGLEKCTRLTALKIDSIKCDNFSDTMCDSLLRALENMNKLESLTLYINPSAITSSKIQNIWLVLGAFKRLQILDLAFQKLGNKACDEEFDILSKSLTKLSKLTHLCLSMTDCHISNTGILQLSKVISELKKLEILNLDFGGSESHSISGKNISRLGKSFENHQALSELTLKIKSVGIDALCAKELVSSLRKLKSLNKLDLSLESVDLNENIKEFFQRNLKHLKLQYDVSFSL